MDIEHDQPTQPRRGFIRQHGLAAGGLLTALMFVVVAGPAVASRVEGSLQQTSVAPLPSSNATLEPQIADTTPNPTTPSLPAVPAVTDVNVTKIQTVPALPNVVVDVAGRRAVSDDDGAIELGPDEAEATVRFVGLDLDLDPPTQSVELAAWSDGSTDLERSLSTIPGPVAELGLVVSNRVFVEMADPGPSDTIAVFRTELGNLGVRIREFSWVPEHVANVTSEGLESTTLTYTLVEPSSAVTAPELTFRPTPEAIWRLTG